MDIKNLKKVIEQISQEKGIAQEDVVSAIESAVSAAYRREYGKRGEIIRAKLDLKTGELKFWRVKTVVDKDAVRIKTQEKDEEEQNPESETKEALPIYNPERHIFLEEAKEVKKDIQVDEELELPLPEQTDFGRIASQAAKQVILQRIRDIEKDSIKRDFKSREGEIISGVVQRIERGNVYIDLGRATGVMFYNEAIPGEHYRIGERLRFYLLAVQEETKTPGLILSRSHPRFVCKLFEMEVPEIHEDLVEIKTIAREAGNRTKIAVSAKAETIDPVGSMVGQRGTRVMTITNELGHEKIDIIEWSEDPEKFIAASMSPAKAKWVEILPRREARVFFPEDQLSLAIGRGGQNVRLAAKLTGWKIDVRSESKPEVTQFQSAITEEENKNKKEESIVEETEIKEKTTEQENNKSVEEQP